ncbi:alanine racemase [Actinoplanes lutulentus]|uniref:alanine racemase n=1 Tax=Actinoplanes lutulentus TaxID=1287878 RepID=UPI0018095E26|nr:alanine racemase [Actinoplanes lutulentus]MBB2940579.1 alanine racemase [Actinoplanes lutulentus]
MSDDPHDAGETAATTAEAVVDLNAIAHNTRLLRSAAAPAAMMAVVKADGFGHGAAQVAQAALASGATWLGVAHAAEALALRKSGFTAPLLFWLPPPPDAVDAVLAAGIDVSVGSVSGLQAVADAAARTGTVAGVHLKIDSGMSRGGAPAEVWGRLFTWTHQFQDAGLLIARGLWTHLASAEETGSAALHIQMNDFRTAIEAARAIGLSSVILHVANSAAALHTPQARFDLVRPGLSLYGIEPVPGRTFGLRPAMTVRAPVVLTKRVPAGTGVSFGPDYYTSRETTLALVPLGFADGVPRRASNRGEFSIRGVRCRVAGRISMDQVVLDVGDLPVREGDTAVMFGPGAGGEPTVSEWALWGDTTANEVLTRIGPRVTRRYLPL